MIVGGTKGQALHSGPVTQLPYSDLARSVRAVCSPRAGSFIFFLAEEMDFTLVVLKLMQAKQNMLAGQL